MIKTKYMLFVGLLFTLAAVPAMRPALSLLEPKASAQSNTSGVYDAYDFEVLAITTAVGFTAADISPANAPSAKKAECTVETQSIRMRYDGGTPTTTVGHLISAGARFEITGQNNVRLWRGIATTGTASVTCTYLR